MKIAIIGSRNTVITDKQIEKVISVGDEIVSGGAKGVDSYVASYAKSHGYKLTEFLPKYNLYGRAAPIQRNKEIVEYSDKIVAFWDGSSRGTLFVIEYAEKRGKPSEIIICK